VSNTVSDTSTKLFIVPLVSSHDLVCPVTCAMLCNWNMSVASIIAALATGVITRQIKNNRCLLLIVVYSVNAGLAN